MRKPSFAALIVILIAMLVAVVPSRAAVPVDSSALRKAVTIQSLMSHLNALEAIANSNGGVRASGTSGYDQSVDYVAGKLTTAGYTVSRQAFQFPFYQELTPAVLAQVTPSAVNYVYDTDYRTMDYSGTGDVTAAVQAVDLLLPPTGGSTSGCEASDFTGFTPGNIALIQRGTCTFALKAQNAQAAGAKGVIIFNEGNTAARSGLLLGTLGAPGITIPVVGTTFALGTQLNNLIANGLTIHLKTDTISETRTTNNLIAETAGGRTDRVVVVGAHLDSTLDGPAMNDNGSGSAAILEIALQMKKLGIQPVNKVRFIWFGAEENGLLGSEYYVSQLSSRDIKNIAVNINVDMIASPNYVRFVYDGNGSDTATAGPNGSKVIEDVFNNYFASQNLATDPSGLTGSSDYAPFLNVGVPIGGVFAGAGDNKTGRQAAIYGGTASAPYAPNYHTAEDTVANINQTVFDQLTDGAAHAVLNFAMTTSSVNGTDKGTANGLASTLEFDGPLAQR